MLQLFSDPSYDVVGRRRWAYLASATFVLIGIGSMVAKGGLRYGIAFAGGTLVQLRFEQPTPIGRVRDALDRVAGGGSGHPAVRRRSRDVVRLPQADRVPADVAARVQQRLATDPILGESTVRRVEFVGPQVGRDLQWQAVQAVAWSVIGILLYIAFRFDLKGGVAAIVALAHDVLVSLGARSITAREMSLPVLAAILTIIGYSANATIVAYDRVRENRWKMGPRPARFADQMNAAINQTLSRTVLTAATTFFATFAVPLRRQGPRGPRLRPECGRDHRHLLDHLHRRQPHRGLDGVARQTGEAGPTRGAGAGGVPGGHRTSALPGETGHGR